MHRLFIALFYCATVSLSAQQPTLMVSSGVASSNAHTSASATAHVWYPLTTIGPVTVVAGLQGGQVYAVPTLISTHTSTMDSTVRAQGTSTITTLQGTVGLDLALAPFSLTILAFAGGANAAYREATRPIYSYGSSSSEALQSTIAAPSWAVGVAARISYHITDAWSITGIVGRDWYRSSVVTADNTAYGAPSYRATFSDGAEYAHIGVSYTLPPLVPRPLDDVLDSAAVRRDQWYIHAILCSAHPFTDQAYNQFNPGLAVQWRDRSQGLTGFAEGGGYQYSEGDRAIYAGGGLLAPVFTEWVKLGVLAGLLTVYDGGGMRVFPALSPRLTIDTPWLSASALLIPAGESTAIGFVVGIPVK
ncbi:MAG: hypothetical protein JSS89_10840 [Bacteroidetes bacterium]|nr:hypothetical protein [Bacteroidota bacterium]